MAEDPAKDAKVLPGLDHHGRERVPQVMKALVGEAQLAEGSLQTLGDTAAVEGCTVSCCKDQSRQRHDGLPSPMVAECACDKTGQPQNAARTLSLRLCEREGPALQSVANHQLTTVQVDVLPPERKELTLAQTGSERRDIEGSRGSPRRPAMSSVSARLSGLDSCRTFGGASSSVQTLRSTCPCLSARPRAIRRTVDTYLRVVGLNGLPRAPVKRVSIDCTCSGWSLASGTLPVDGSM